jgi:nitric oxide reductase activation protein
VLQRQKELGNILEIRAEAPRFHGTEDGRWDYRITLVWKNAAALHEAFPEAELRRLFPDQETFRREEQRRFEILSRHWDVPVVQVDLTKP